MSGNMGKVSRQRTAANQADSHTLSINERLLKECNTLYTDPENGKSSEIFRKRLLNREQSASKRAGFWAGLFQSGKSSEQIKWLVASFIHKMCSELAQKNFSKIFLVKIKEKF